MSRRIHGPWDLRYGRRPVDVDLRYFFAPGQLLGQWLAELPWLELDATAVDSPNDFSANPPWTPDNVTTPSAVEIRSTVANATHSVIQTLGNAVGPVESITLRSVAPVGAQQWMLLRLIPGGYVYFDVVNGVIGSGSVATAVIAPGTMGPGYDLTIYPQQIATAGSLYRIYLALADGVTTGVGNPADGATIQQAEIDQLSVKTLLNRWGHLTLPIYGNRFDLANLNKPSQPVFLPDRWNGLPALVYSGANYLEAPMGAPYAGIGKPLCHLSAIEPLTAALGFIYSLTNSALANPLQGGRAAAATYHGDKRDDTGFRVLTDSGIAPTLARHIFSHLHNGTAEWMWEDETALLTNSPSNVGNTTVDTFAVGCSIIAGVPLNFSQMVMRDAAMIMSATLDQRAAAKSFMLLENPL